MMDYFRHLASTLGMLDDAQLGGLVALCKRTMERSGTLWLAGNGGSAAVAQHWACDLSKQAGARVLALGANGAVLTAWANDVSYGAALSEELARLARTGDALICLSCSGTSPNIAAVLRQAHRMQLDRALISGPERPSVTPLTVRLSVPHDDYGVIEDCFAAIGHYVTYELRATK
jgi:D-sedoheptulose 7-phosphate isomerase